jgi:hypothetical protein
MKAKQAKRKQDQRPLPPPLSPPVFKRKQSHDARSESKATIQEVKAKRESKKKEAQPKRADRKN